MDKALKTGEVARRLKVHPLTVFRWIHSGKIRAEQNVAGTWHVSESEIGRLLGLQPPAKSKRAILYARVSSHEQKPHLQSQLQRLQKHATQRGYEIVKTYAEVASGLNENRRKLTSAYNMLRDKKADLILVEFKDRLSRFGFNYLTQLAQSVGATVEVVNGDVKKDAMQELVEDMISIVTIFSARLYGLRSRRFKAVTGAMRHAVHD